MLIRSYLLVFMVIPILLPNLCQREGKLEEISTFLVLAVEIFQCPTHQFRYVGVPFIYELAECGVLDVGEGSGISRSEQFAVVVPFRVWECVVVTCHNVLRIYLHSCKKRATMSMSGTAKMSGSLKMGGGWF